MTRRFMLLVLLLGCVAAGTWFVQRGARHGDPGKEIATEADGAVMTVAEEPGVAVPEKGPAEPATETMFPAKEVERLSQRTDGAGAPSQAPSVVPTATPAPPPTAFEPWLPEAEVWTYPLIMQQNASNNLFRARSKLAAATSEYDRYLALGDTAKLEFVFGNSGQALTNATELLALHARFNEPPWRGGQAAHDGNFVLGRIAAQQGLVEEARQYLLEAGKSTGSPVLGSFGPNMSLARDLLVRGEREAVLTYFDLCRKFWGSGEKQLTQWSEEVKAGRMPDFGPNIYY